VRRHEPRREANVGLQAFPPSFKFELGPAERPGVGDILLFCEVAGVGVHRRTESAAAAVVGRLEQLGHRVAAVSGVVSGSSLARREVEQSSGIPCVRTSELRSSSGTASGSDSGRMRSGLGTVA